MMVFFIEFTSHFQLIHFLMIFNWFHDNYMVPNPRNCYFIILGDNNQIFDLICQDHKIEY